MNEVNDLPRALRLPDLLSFARELGREAGRQLLDWRDRAVASVKADGSVVTEADHAVDRFLFQQIQARYPDHGVLSEEANTVYEGQPFTWVIDPLDGTANYALGVCYWGCSIAVLSGGVPLVGVLVVPNLDAEFWAVRGQGAFLNGKRLGGPPHGVSARNSFFALCSRSLRYLDLPMLHKGRLLGSAAYDLAAVAQGIAVGLAQVTPHIWDLAAGWLFLKEAGRMVGPLFASAPDPFPMLPGADYQDKVFPLLACADEQVFRQIQELIRIKPSAREQLDAWAATGWSK